MKLELKHLAPYLPYDLKGINHLKDISTLGIKDEVFTYTNFYENKRIKEKFTYLSIDSFIKEKYKPILFQLSSLTKEITINGEKFNPYDKINKKYPNTPQFTDYVKGWMQYYGVMDSKCEYVCILKLFEWKIDVFGLIEAGLAEPVTEDFNPYK